MYKTCELTKNQWDKFVQSRDEANFLHSWEWGGVHKNLGQRVYRYGIVDEKECIVSVVLALIEDARRGRYIEVPGGPIIDWANEALVKFVVSSLKALAQKEKCVFVRARPQLALTAHSLDIFKSMGFRRAPMHLHAENTIIIDLKLSEDELLKCMRRQTRYEIKRGLKSGVTTSYSSDKSNVGIFYQLQQDTAMRQNFIPPSRRFLEAELHELGPDHIRIYKAEQEGVLLAMALVVFYGNEVDYHQGASTPEGRKLPGAHVLQWRIIQDAKKMGYRRYNLFGVAPRGAQNHRYSGVSTFKRGFGGDEVNYVPAHDLVISKLRYVKNYAVESLRKKVRRV